jgi:hypothetical protein
MATLAYDAAATLSHETADEPVAPGAATGGVRHLLRIEGAVALAAALVAYRMTGWPWWLFGALFLLPDVLMLGYLAGRTFGAALYNAGHTYIAPAALGLAGWGLGAPALFGPALIWAAPLGFDRLLGYGLKYGTAFGATHLGWRGRPRSTGIQLPGSRA